MDSTDALMKDLEIMLTLPNIYDVNYDEVVKIFNKEYTKESILELNSAVRELIEIMHLCSKQKGIV